MSDGIQQHTLKHSSDSHFLLHRKKIASVCRRTRLRETTVKKFRGRTSEFSEKTLDKGGVDI